MQFYSCLFGALRKNYKDKGLAIVPDAWLSLLYYLKGIEQFNFIYFVIQCPQDFSNSTKCNDRENCNFLRLGLYSVAGPRIVHFACNL